jgi:Bacterial RNA polymerase, alpha chain C terminal domain
MNFLDTPIESLDFGKWLTTRIHKVCRTNTEYKMIAGKFDKVEEPIVTVADLVRRTERDLLLTLNLHHKSVDAIKRVLAEHGLALAQEERRG